MRNKYLLLFPTELFFPFCLVPYFIKVNFNFVTVFQNISISITFSIAFKFNYAADLIGVTF